MRHHRRGAFKTDVAGREHLEKLNGIDWLIGRIWRLVPEIGGNERRYRRLLAPRAVESLQPRNGEIVFPVFPTAAAAIDYCRDYVVPVRELGLGD
jgi:hypothetical protein